MNIHFHTNNELVAKTSQFIEEFNQSDVISVKTSGSTGVQKKYQVEKEKFIYSAARTCAFFNLKKGDRVFLCISPDYIGGKMMIIRALTCNLNLEIGSLSSFPFNSKIKLDFAAFVPLQIKSIIEKDISYLKMIKNIIIGGGKLDEATEKILVEHKINAFVTFGMTETLSHIALRKVGTKEYQVLEDVQIKVDPLDRLIIQDKKTTGIEYLQTNDLVEIISPTQFIWKGRHDNIINSGGIKISPEEVENKLMKSINSNFFISKRKDASLGEKVILIIEGTKEDNYNFENLLSKYEIPKEIYYLSQFKYTETSKIDRYKTLKLLQFG